jgi:Trypsin
MQRLLVAILVTSLATIYACKGVPTNTNPTQPKEVQPEAVEDCSKELPSFVTNGFTIIKEGQPDPFGCVGKVLQEDGTLVGSAVLVSPTVVLTAAHCIKDTNAYWFETNDCKRFKITQCLIHETYIQDTSLGDIGAFILETPCDKVPATLLKELNELSRTEELTTVGYSYSTKKISDPGTFFYYGTILEEPCYIKFLPLKGSVWFGDSGGALFEDGGKLAGIISSLSFKDGSIFENSATHVFLYHDWIMNIVNSHK